MQLWDRRAGDPTCSDLGAAPKPQQFMWYELPAAVCSQHRAVTIWFRLHKVTRAQRCLDHFSHADCSCSSANCGIWTQHDICFSRLTCFTGRGSLKGHPTASQGTATEPKQIYEPLDLLRNSAANISSPNLQIPPLQTCYPREEENSIQGDKFPNEPKVKCVTIFSIFFYWKSK